MTLSASADDPFTELAQSLRALEAASGEGARPAVARVCDELREAISRREQGDFAGVLTAIRQAMERLAAMGGEVAGADGTMMREVARVFVKSLGADRNGGAAEASEARRTGDRAGRDHSER